MKLKLITALSLTTLVFLSGVFSAFADYSADTSYSSDYTAPQYSDTYSYSDSDTLSSNSLYTEATESESSDPIEIKIDAGEIEDKIFNAELNITTETEIASADFTIIYDSDVLTLLSSEAAEIDYAAAAAAETEDGKIQYQLLSSSGVSLEEPYMSMQFQVLDTNEKTTVIYVTINSLQDVNSNELTYRSDGTIVNIESAAAVDASADESMYSEIKILKSDEPISYESLGFSGVTSVTFENEDLATADDEGITALSSGITNMTVEFEDETYAYYRLVISEPNNEASEEAESSVLSADEVILESNDITKTETKSSQNVKKLIIYLLVIAAVAAIIVEYFMIVDNPYAKAFAFLKIRRQQNSDNSDEEMNHLPNDENTDDEYSSDEDLPGSEESFFENSGSDEEAFEGKNQSDEIEPDNFESPFESDDE
ncbi:MAG: hypothetical protein LUE12_04420 [Ruminococcus sp.]|nr:hypothetical protein [Ruminococcus sp.]